MRTVEKCRPTGRAEGRCSAGGNFLQKGECGIWGPRQAANQSAGQRARQGQRKLPNMGRPAGLLAAWLHLACCAVCCVLIQALGACVENGCAQRGPRRGGRIRNSWKRAAFSSREGSWLGEHSWAQQLALLWHSCHRGEAGVLSRQSAGPPAQTAAGWRAAAVRHSPGTAGALGGGARVGSAAVAPKRRAFLQPSASWGGCTHGAPAPRALQERAHGFSWLPLDQAVSRSSALRAARDCSLKRRVPSS